MRRATGNAALLLLILPMACGKDAVIEEPVDAGVLPPVAVAAGGGLTQVQLPTYEGSGEVTEPDVVFLPEGWHGYAYWMAYNPYPHGNDTYENASIIASNDGFDWDVPWGLRNPVVPLPDREIKHNSDPDLVYVRQLDRMILFYRGVTQLENVLWAMSSSDGIHWGNRVEIGRAPNHSLISPSVVLAPNRRPKLYYVDAGPLGCATGRTRVLMRRWSGNMHNDDALVGSGWSPPVATNLNGPPGWLIWHVDVIWVGDRSEYWAVFPAFRAGSDCSHADLFMARSKDAVTWQVLAEPVLTRADVPWMDRALYRASMVYQPADKSFRLWFSGVNHDGRWSIGHGAFPIQELLAGMGELR